VRVIEAFFAAVLLLSCLTLIPAGTISKDRNGNLASRAENVLLSLDSDGHLASLVDNHDWAGLRDCLESAFPLTLWFNLTVHDENLNVLNYYPICNGGAVSDKIVSVNYVCASQSSTYAVYLFQLQLAGVD
jgi:hypothetical protein